MAVLEVLVMVLGTPLLVTILSRVGGGCGVPSENV